MFTIPRKIFPLALVGILSVAGLKDTRAQGLNFYGQNARAFSETDRAVAAMTTFKDIGKNVYAIDNLADQMVFRYGWELRFTDDDINAAALHDRMKGHARLTNELINAYRGKGGTSFRKAAYAVSDSVSQLQTLQKKTKVSESVSNMISQSVPMATYVVTNASHFKPGSDSGL